MQKKPDFTKKILNSLAGKKAVNKNDLVSKIALEGSKSPVERSKLYAAVRALGNLNKAGFIERMDSGQTEYIRLTKKGKQKVVSQKLDRKNVLVNPQWDFFWRIVILDLPEERKSEREMLRYLLKKAGFILYKNSVWVSPYPYEHFFFNLKKDLGLKSEMMIIVTNSIDEISNHELLKKVFN